MKKIIFLLLGILAMLIVAGCTVNVSDKDNDNTINVQGSSEIKVEPDEAEVWVGASFVKDTAEEAQNAVNSVINDIVDGLRYKGFTEDNMETTQLSLHEEYSWNEGKRESIGWRASQTLKIKTNDLTKVGEIVDVAVENGANQINNINFQLSDEREKEYKKQALTEAAKNAKDKAETIAESLGVKLGTIKTVSESNYYYAPYRYAMAEDSGMDAVEEAAKVLPSDVTVTANIAIVYNVG
jgi:uncharacterized protein